MREFKFRVWENVENKMNYDCIVGDNFIIFNYTGDCEDDLFTGDVDFVHLCELNRKYFTIMQYTGIRDMTGKEIYEGDILGDEYGNNIISKIAYNKGVFRVIEKHNRFTDPIDYFATGKLVNGVYIKDMKVIGNIYENKDLLED